LGWVPGTGGTTGAACAAINQATDNAETANRVNCNFAMGVLSPIRKVVPPQANRPYGRHPIRIPQEPPGRARD